MPTAAPGERADRDPTRLFECPDEYPIAALAILASAEVVRVLEVHGVGRDSLRQSALASPPGRARLVSSAARPRPRPPLPCQRLSRVDGRAILAEAAERPGLVTRLSPRAGEGERARCGSSARAWSKDASSVLREGSLHSVPSGS
jgi:hypothetical protein